MPLRRNPQQVVREAFQIARDHHLHIKETATPKGPQFSVYRICPQGRPVYVGKRSTPAGLRSYVAKLASFH